MNIRDSESSSEDELPQPRNGLASFASSSVAESTGSGHHLQPFGNQNGMSLLNRNDMNQPFRNENASSSTFASVPTIQNRAVTPRSPTIQSAPSQLHEQFTAAGPSIRSPRSSFMAAGSPILTAAPVAVASKDRDDPTIPSNSPPDRHATPTALSRLLAARTITTSPTPSRTSSYIDGNPNLVVQPSSNASTTSLHDHLYTRGLLEGKHSDIAVIAFNHRYNLHRLILDRAPFFTTALSEPWLESRSKEVHLHPDEVDPTITQKAFELALKRLYGCEISGQDEDSEAVGLFATGCWLEMPELVESSITSILRQMDASTLSPLIRLVTNNYYGRAGDKILASAKAMLCRDGWEMPLKFWDDVPGEIVREIVGGDGFYVVGEWERWVLAKRLLDRRLKQKAVELGLAMPGRSGGVFKAPEVLTKQSDRRLGDIRTTSIASVGSSATGEGEDVWMTIYGDPDIEPLLVLMDHGIHYVHLDFERLQYIRQAKDIFGLGVLPEHIIQNALWQQMELRQKVVNARESDLELGLSQAAEAENTPPALRQTPASTSAFDRNASLKGKQRETSILPISEQDAQEDEEYEMARQPRKFWIPSADCNIVMGGSSEPVITTNTTSSFLRLSSGLPAGIDPTDVLWASNFAGPSPSRATDRSRRHRLSEAAETEDGISQPKPVAYSSIPPFRFAAEFPNPRGLKEKKRVYSRTVFYAGSHWNIYIQKVRSQKNPQLGVYLHRAKERETNDSESYAGGTDSARNIARTVDEQIGLLEREMLLRSADGRRAVGRRSMPTRHSDRGNTSSADDGSIAAYRRRVYGAGDGTVLDTSFTAFDSDTDSDSSPVDQSPEVVNPLSLQDPSTASSAGATITQFPRPSSSDGSRSVPQNIGTARPHSFNAKRIPTLPAYTDARPTIKTYFKIYSPSKGGRFLSVYESAPDKFDFSQSWGWKSSTLMLDEGFSNNAAESCQDVNVSDVTTGAVDDAPVGAAAGGEGATEGGGLADEVLARQRAMERERKKRKEGCLRFMVVIGNL